MVRKNKSYLLKAEELVSNHVLNEQEFKQRKEILKSKPVKVRLSTGDRCNLICPICKYDHGVPLKDLTLKEFLPYQGIIGPARSIFLYGWGEPFINSSYDAIFDFVLKRRPCALIYISTNGTLLNEYWINKIYKTQRIILNFSLNACNNMMYKKLFGTSNFIRVIQNIKALLKLRGKHKYPILTLSYILQEDNVYELPDFILLAKNLGVDKVLISTLTTFKNSQEKFQININKEIEDVYVRSKERGDQHEIPVSLVSGMSKLKISNNYYCKDPWEFVKLDSSGNVGTCDYSNRVIGNIYQKSFKDIWNSKDMQFIRKTVNTNDPPEDCKVCPKKCDSKEKEIFNREYGS